jgi:hypothetical protein
MLASVSASVRAGEGCTAVWRILFGRRRATFSRRGALSLSEASLLTPGRVLELVSSRCTQLRGVAVWMSSAGRYVRSRFSAEVATARIAAVTRVTREGLGASALDDWFPVGRPYRQHFLGVSRIPGDVA